MTIYCSKKLETFMGEMTPATQLLEPSLFGDWNGHSISVERKRCLIFMNNKTCYSVVMANVYKKDLKDFSQVFKERVIRQLDYDLSINEEQEVRFRKELGNIFLTTTNNDKKIAASINRIVGDLTYPNYQGGIANWDELTITGYMNDCPMATKIAANLIKRRGYFKPIELMKELIE